MEFKIDESYAKNFNNWKMKEETSKSQKNLKRKLKSLEESSDSSSDEESDEDERQRYVAEMDALLRGLETEGAAYLTKAERSVKAPGRGKRKEAAVKEARKPLYGKELNEKILRERGDDDEAYLQEIEAAARMDTKEILQGTVKVDFSALCDFEGDLFTPAKVEREIKVEEDTAEVEGAFSDSAESSEEEIPEKNDNQSAMVLNMGRHEDTMRAKNSKRKDMRKEKKERKLKEKEDTLKKLKNIKLKELEEKFEQIKKVNPEFIKHLTVEDLDDDFDSDKHNELVERLYKEEENYERNDDEKPVFSDDDNYNYLDIDSDNENIEAVKHITQLNEATPETTISTTNKKKSYFVNVDNDDDNCDEKNKSSKIQYNSIEHGSFKKFIKKYPFNLNHDIIKGVDGDDTVCKFKYRSVDAQDFGLTFEEIILAQNKELNQWASLKKVVSIRSQNDEEKDNYIYHSEKRLQKKKDILLSVYKTEQDEIEEENEQNTEEASASASKASKKRLRKALNKKKLREDLSTVDVSMSDVNQKDMENVVENLTVKKKKRKTNSVNVSMTESNENTTESVPIKEKKAKKINCTITEKVSDSGNTEDFIRKDLVASTSNDHVKVKKSKSKKTKVMPILDNNRLQSYGVKTHYYRDLVNKTEKK